MPWTIRTFIRSRSGDIKRISHASFGRLWNGDDGERWPDYANDFVYVATAYVERNEDGAALRKIEYMRLRLDAAGRLDEEWRQQGSRAAVECLDWAPFAHSEPSNVLQAGHHFAKRRYRSEHAWEPTKDQVEAIVRGALTKLPR